MRGFGLGDMQVTAGMGIPSGNFIDSFEDWNTFVKAIQTSGWETDSAQLTGSQALRYESLEGTLRKVIEAEEGFKLFRSLKRNASTSAVHEWALQTGIGGQPGGMFNSEVGEIASNVGDYVRQIVLMKFLMTQAAISHVASVQGQIVNLKATENRNALLRLGRAANYASYHGNSAVSPMQFDGITKQLTDFQAGRGIIDVDGDSDVGRLVQRVYTAFGDVISIGSFGKLTHMMVDPLVQNELDQDLDPAYRVYLNDSPNNIARGAPVGAIKTSFGPVATDVDIWIENAMTAQPMQALYGTVPLNAPGAPTLAILAQTGQANSRFTAGRDGTYFYVVAAVNTNGVESLVSNAVSAAVAVGGALQLTITPHVGLGQTGYAIYRSRRNPGTAPANTDYRLVTRIPAHAVPTTATVFQDLNRDIPGSSQIYLLNRVNESIGWVQLLPVTQFPLYPTNRAIIPWAVLMYGALALYIPNHHRIIKNFLPSRAPWRPF